MNSQGTGKTEPDPDAIKMFVGQIPRSMDESDLRKMFEEFGPVFQLNVLRDKVTGQSKGCCFVTFYTRKSALEAQNQLHNIKTMAGMQHPIQMKPADCEKRNEERKLFVGMLSKKCNENEVRMMFAPFGTIEECTVLREQNGQSRGCAFVTYASKQCAQNAIKGMHHSQTMEGCRFPLVVRFADTQKEKEMKKLQQMQANLLNTNLTGLAGLGPQYLNLLQQASSSPGGNMPGGLSNLGNLGLSALQIQQILSAAAQAAAALQNNPGDNSNSSGLTGNSSGGALGNMAGGGFQGSLSQGSLSSSGASGGGQMGGSSGLNGMSGSSAGNGAGGGAGSGSNGSQGGMDTLSQAYTGIQQYAGLSGLLSQAFCCAGPDGANLFIYHLPQEFADQDLMQMFLPFGTVISAKVFIDKQTNLSKCFGFVSYDNPMSAQAAIQAMNGFQIGMKRLKVQLKRPKSDSKPY
ncbi:hypothetical protein CAPTEDRAFT_144233 [Capitella teleta]|uniref:RRM domain-containing protein n=1 Tax=Capitella teleta TaxID=283909 RepID=R7V089_CAPTE|nr:hypothetical protein CAPTEDRAFT_144233 [Capitella teleta]|eukprot:ELU11974.1 hypothetical protein CAPTEDRAFT_144233 [Capitella teleta]